MRIVAFCKGLFGLVDSQESGRGLSELSETMAATVDVTDLLGLARLKEEYSGTITGPSLQPIPLHTVPNEKCWRVRAWGCRVAPGAGETANAYHLGVKLANLTGAGTFIAAVSEPISVAASSFGVMYAKSMPLLLPPGAILCAYGQNVVGPPDLDSFVVFEEFDAS